MGMILSDAVLLDILSYSSSEAVAVYDNDDLRVRFVNKKMLSYWGRKESSVGRGLYVENEVVISASFVRKAKEVWRTGLPFIGSDMPMEVYLGGKVETCYFDMELRPFLDTAGNTYALLHCGTISAAVKREGKGNGEIEKRVLEDLFDTTTDVARLTQANIETIRSLFANYEDEVQLKEMAKSILSRIIVREEQLDMALKAANFGTWTLYFDSNRLHWDEITQSLLGFEGVESLDVSVAMEAVVPNDRKSIADIIENAKRPGNGGEYEILFRVNKVKASPMRWINSKGKVFFDQNGIPLWLIGVSRDVTDSMLQQEQITTYHHIIAQKEKELRMVIDAAGIGTFSISKNMDEIWFNEHAQKQFGFELGSSLGFKQFLSCFSDKYRKPLHEAFFQLVSNNVPMDMLCEIENVETKAGIWIRLVAIQYLDAKQTYIQGILIDLTQAKEEMQRKLDFISIASHELKTPLTTILTFLQLLSKRYHQFEESKKIEMLGQALDQGGRMKNLIEGFLNVSKLQNGQLELDKSVFNFCDLMEKIKAMYEVIQPNNKLYFNTSSCFLVNADMHKVEGVILNFINNAIKYTPVESSVYVTTFIEGAQCGITVTDQGLGIPIKDQPYIFDKFYRVNQKGGERIQGFGIGLYISAEIVKQHGGQIGLRSTYGKGAEFWFSLPVHRVIDKISYDVGDVN
ncbi:sensor histidine kinase [Sphingobacterium tabacisoli]|uniref:histidine kinase n=1 Tax=Sphingobacterium tabacisoli TaxID=2044855 RepID=A0ABW5L6T4_9SPHI|nr:PAS domain-containing sensor histidine kinase [Sphingobacterium tabacisoli]